MGAHQSVSGRSSGRATRRVKMFREVGGARVSLKVQNLRAIRAHERGRLLLSLSLHVCRGVLVPLACLWLWWSVSTAQRSLDACVETKPGRPPVAIDGLSRSKCRIHLFRIGLRVLSGGVTVSKPGPLRLSSGVRIGTTDFLSRSLVPILPIPWQCLWLSSSVFLGL